MSSHNLVQLLEEYLCSEDSPVLRYGCKVNEREALKCTLRAFFRSTMDEVRLRHANDAAIILLRAEDIDGSVHFREGVLRKELVGHVQYDRQRDHTAHTLNNYLLGWFLFDKSDGLQTAMREALRARSGKSVDDNRLRELFNRLWIWVSLLHDIGYLLEGAVDPLALEGTHENVLEGARYICEYFEHRYWRNIGLSATDYRREASELHGLPPSIRSDTIAAVSASLRNLGEPNALTKAIQDSLSRRSFTPLPDGFELPADAFLLWSKHYELYGTPTMSQSIGECARQFEEMLWTGLPGAGGIRTLDHGVCSGLIQLRYSTVYFQIHRILKERVDKARNDSLSSTFFGSSRATDYDAYWWWTGVVWASAAAAIHNIVQMKTGPKVALSDDPLAFLGILVDLLQEWDRYNAHRGRHSRPLEPVGLPVQGVDVTAYCDGERLILGFPWGPNPKKSRKESLSEELDNSVPGWRQFVTLESRPTMAGHPSALTGPR